MDGGKLVDKLCLPQNVRATVPEWVGSYEMKG